MWSPNVESNVFLRWLRVASMKCSLIACSTLSSGMRPGRSCPATVLPKMFIIPT